VTVCVAWVGALALTLISNARHARLVTTQGEK
jgi:hypothetical protein